MSELKFKAYGELEISEALSDASHVIIEENGDVKRFPANSIGKVKTVNGAEPDENGNVAVEIPAPVQPDLSQNDPEAPDYVKGVIRQESLPEGYPYKTETVNVILPETEFTTVERDGVYMAVLESPVELIAGHAYNVTFDGDEYTCVASNPIAGATFVGNAKFYDGTDTGEPFGLVVNSSRVAVATESANTYTISVNEVVTSVMQMDEKFIPRTIVTLTKQDDGTYVADKTNDEIIQLHQAGKEVTAKIDSGSDDVTFVQLQRADYLNRGHATVMFAYNHSVNSFTIYFSKNQESDGNIYSKKSAYLTFIPNLEQGESVANAAGETVTASEFNALLNSLRYSGIIAR